MLADVVVATYPLMITPVHFGQTVWAALPRRLFVNGLCPKAMVDAPPWHGLPDYLPASRESWQRSPWMQNRLAAALANRSCDAALFHLDRLRILP
jgi:hypothetical protein